MAKRIMTCINCKKQYDLIKVMDKAKDKHLYCPYCGCHLGIKNN